MGDKKTFVYIKDPEFAWIPATLVKTEGDKAHVTVPQYKDEQSINSDGGRAATGEVSDIVNLKDYPHKVLPLQNVDANGNLQVYSDMVKLPYLHEVRYRSDASAANLALDAIRSVSPCHSYVCPTGWYSVQYEGPP